MLNRINLRSLLAAAGAVCLLGLGQAQAAELKIGYVDMKTAVENTGSYKKGIAHLKESQAAEVKKLQALSKEVSALEKELETQAGMFSPVTLAQKQLELKTKRTQFERKQQDAQEKLATEKNMLDVSIGQKFSKVMVDYAKQKGFDIIFPRPMMLYADPKLDVTADITKLLDAAK